MNRIVLILLLVGAFAELSLAQSLKAYERSAKEAVDKKNYASALAYYRIILEETGNSSIHNYYKAAESARKFRIYNTSENYYRKVVQHKEKNTYPLTYFRLGQVLKNQGKYDAAIGAFTQYIDSTTTLDSEYADKAHKQINDCQWAKELVANPEDHEIEHLDTLVNTGDTELSPVKIDDQLYYTSFGSETKDQDIPNTFARTMLAYEGEQGEWMDASINDEPDKHVAHASFTEDQQQVFYNICHSLNASQVRCAIYSRRKDAAGNWGEAVKLPNHINLDGYTATQPSYGVDKANGYAYLFFASDRPEGEGGLDIWCSLVNADGTYSKPFNIEVVNSKADDITPFFYGPSQSLFFSSNGYQNIGGFDIYESKKKDDKWGTPVHLGYPVNSSYDDSYYSVSSDGESGLFTSNRPGAICRDTSLECTSCNDIYQYQRMIEIKLLALTYNEISGEPLAGCDVQLIDLTTGEPVPLVASINNEFNYLLEPDKEYKLIATKDKYRSAELVFDTKGITSSSALEEKLYLRPMVDLVVLTYDRRDSTELTGCTVDLFNFTMNKQDSILQLEDSNRFLFPLDVDGVYKVIGWKLDFGEDGAEVSTKGISEPVTLTQKLYLDPQVDAYPILPLYFDNDYPNPNTFSTRSTKNYGQTYAAYYGKKEEFKAKFGGDPEKQQQVESFFEDEVRAGYERLMIFMQELADYLAQGNKVDVILKGYASPLAKNQYNHNLTQRRIDSMIKQFKAFDNGLLLPYFANGQLSVREEPYGEERAAEGISDNPRMPRQSIYSVAASRERRLEIVEIFAEEEPSTQPENFEE